MASLLSTVGVPTVQDSVKAYGPDIKHTNVKYVDPLSGIVYLRSMFAVQWFYATLPMHNPDKLPPTHVLCFDEEPMNSRLKSSVQEGARLLDQ